MQPFSRMVGPPAALSRCPASLCPAGVCPLQPRSAVSKPPVAHANCRAGLQLSAGFWPQTPWYDICRCLRAGHPLRSVLACERVSCFVPIRQRCTSTLALVGKQASYTTDAAACARRNSTQCASTAPARRLSHTRRCSSVRPSRQSLMFSLSSCAYSCTTSCVHTPATCRVYTQLSAHTTLPDAGWQAEKTRLLSRYCT